MNKRTAKLIKQKAKEQSLITGENLKSKYKYFKKLYKQIKQST
jgi:hypothetical protein